MRFHLLAALLFAASPLVAADTLPGTQPLTWDGDLSLKMVDDLHTFADRLTEESIAKRARHWNRDFSSPEAYKKSIEPNRKRLAKYLGVYDTPLGYDLSTPEADEESTTRLLQTDDYIINLWRFPVRNDFALQGLFLMSRTQGSFQRVVVVIPDADQTPEMLIGLDDGLPEKDQIARRLAENGCTVVIPRLVSRKSHLSVIAGGMRKTNQPHREFIYRQAFEMGRHVIGYEIEGMRRMLDRALVESSRRVVDQERVGVIGFGEGGLLALYLSAIDPRVDVALVSGSFGPREGLFDEPIYRNVWGLLDEFGDAELASMIAPRKLIVEACASPDVKGPPPEDQGTRGAAPGKITTPPLDAVLREVERAKDLVRSGHDYDRFLSVVTRGDGNAPSDPSDDMEKLLRTMFSPQLEIAAPSKTPEFGILKMAEVNREQYPVHQMIEHTQALVRESEYVRKAWWQNADRKSRDPAKWEASLKPYRDHLYDEVLGRFDLPKLPPNARTRKAYETDKYVGYEVVLDVFGKNADAVDVWAYGTLLVPKDIKPGEKRPVVVCQHGLEGRPQHTIEAVPPGEAPYHHFAAALAERGFITFAPQNPYIGKNHFRQLVRKLYPLKKTLWSVIVPQHEQITDWLASLEFVDGERIGFYGLSYGGKTAMRVPALVERYCLSICSGDFNEWIRKNTSVRDTFSYMGTHEYEMYEFDLGHTFNYAEMAYLIAPRPFMVERGHRDGVGIDEWVDYEYAKVRLLYADLKIPERTEIEHFDGPHTIHGVGTYAFLHRHLNWPEPKE